MKTLENLEDLAPLLEPLLASVEPSGRRKLIDRMMRFVRRANDQRIASNVEPDGSAMVARKPRKRKRGKMFRHIGKASNLRVRVTPDQGELRFGNGLVERTAAEHHHGLEGFVGKTRSGQVIRTKFEARRLLGFGQEQDDLMSQLIDHVSEAI